MRLFPVYTTIIIILGLGALETSLFGQVSSSPEPDSIRVQIIWKNDNHNDTLWHTYINNGTLEEGDYLIANRSGRNELNGQVLLFSKEGILKLSRNFLNDKLDGPYISFFNNGAIQRYWNYYSGVCEGESFAMHKNGVLAWRGNYLDGKPNGPRYVTDTLGRPVNGKDSIQISLDKYLIVYCRNGLPEGYVKIVDRLGRLTQEVNYKSGKPHGIMHSYQSNSELKSKEIYVDGVYKCSFSDQDSLIGSALTELVSGDRSNVTYRLERIPVNYRLGNRYKALEDLNYLFQAYSFQSENEQLSTKDIVGLIFELGRINFEKRDFYEAQSYFEKCLEIDNRHCKSMLYLGLVHEKIANKDSDSSYFERAIECDPSMEIQLKQLKGKK